VNDKQRRRVQAGKKMDPMRLENEERNTKKGIVKCSIREDKKTRRSRGEKEGRRVDRITGGIEGNVHLGRNGGRKEARGPLQGRLKRVPGDTSREGGKEV